MTERIGFIGLGLMGRPMARHLLTAGYPLTVFNRSRPAIDELASAGARAAHSPREVAEQSDLVITMCQMAQMSSPSSWRLMASRRACVKECSSST